MDEKYLFRIIRLYNVIGTELISIKHLMSDVTLKFLKFGEFPRFFLESVYTTSFCFYYVQLCVAHNRLA